MARITGHQQHLVDPREVHRRIERGVIEERGPALVDRADASDRDAAREQPALARRDEGVADLRSEEHTSELQSRLHLVCRLLLEKKKNKSTRTSLALIAHDSPHPTLREPRR